MMSLFKTEQAEEIEELLKTILPILQENRALAMRQTMAARIPECADFGGIAQDLDYVIQLIENKLKIIE